MNQNQPQPNPNPTPPEPQKVSFWKSKDPAIVIVRIIIYIFIGIPILGIIGAMVLVSLNTYRNAHRSTTATPTPSSSVPKSSTTTNTNDISNLSANDQQIAADVVWLTSQPLTYYTIHKTFIGWVPDTTAIDAQIKNLGSEIKIQGIGANTFVIYANLPQSNKIYCADNNKFGGVIDSIAPTQITCK